jgi:hypothetical protein
LARRFSRRRTTAKATRLQLQKVPESEDEKQGNNHSAILIIGFNS